MSDRIGVFNQGRIEQVGTPQRCTTRRPRASSRSSSAPPTCCDGERGAAPGRQRSAMLRPERIRLGDAAGRARQRRGRAKCSTSAPFTRVHGRAPGAALQADLPRPASRAGRPATRVHLHWDDDAAVACRWRSRSSVDERRRERIAGGATAPSPGRLRRGCPTCSTRAAACCCSLLLAPPLLWFGVVYLGSLFALLRQQLLPSRRLHRPGGARVHAEELRRALPTPANVDVACARIVHGGARSRWPARVIALPAGLLHGALCARPAEGAALHRGDAAAVVELPGAAVRVEAAAGEGRRDLVGCRSSCTSTWLLDALLACPAIGGPLLSFSPPRHFHRLRLHVAAVHDPADPGRDRAHPGSLHRSLGRPRRAPGADLPQA